MNKNLVIGVVVLLFVAGASYLFFMQKPSTTPAMKAESSETSEMENEATEVEEAEGAEEGVVSPGQMTDSTMMPAVTGEIQMYTLADIAQHSKAEDCWMAINGKVYDTTPYIQKQIHPGGAALLLGCGKDASAIFNLRPQDNKSHSEKARGYLANYYIGEFVR